MVGAVSNALTGFKAATERLETSANNVANSNSTAKLEDDGTFSNKPFIPQAVVSVSQQEGGVGTATVPKEPTTVRRFEPSSGVADAERFVEAPNVDIAEEFVNQIIASYDAQANLRTIEVQNEIFESTLDIFT